MNKAELLLKFASEYEMSTFTGKCPQKFIVTASDPEAFSTAINQFKSVYSEAKNYLDSEISSNWSKLLDELNQNNLFRNFASARAAFDRVALNPETIVHNMNQAVSAGNALSGLLARSSTGAKGLVVHFNKYLSQLNGLMQTAKTNAPMVNEEFGYQENSTKTESTPRPKVKTESQLYAENSKSAEYMANILQRLTTLPDEKMLPIPANAKNISDMNNAKTKIVPFLTRLILTLDGESADKYQRIIKAFQAKYLNQNLNKLTEFNKIPQKVLDPNTPSGAAKYLSSGPGKLPPPA